MIKKLIIFCSLIILVGCTPTTPETSDEVTTEEKVAQEEKQAAMKEQKIEEVLNNHPYKDLLFKELVDQSVEEIIVATAQEYNIPAESYQIAYNDLQSDESYYYHEKDIVSAASTIKVPIAVHIIDGIDKKLWDYSTEVYYDLAYYEPGAGSVTSGPYGVYYPIEVLLEEMIVESDNTATNILFSYYQSQTGKDLRKEINKKVEKESFPAEYSQSNVITAEILELYLRLLLEEEKYQPIIDWMKQTERTENFKDYIQSDMATKHGINNLAHHDTGILFDGENPLYSLVVLTDGAQPRSDEFMATVNLRLAFRAQMNLL